MMKEFWIKRDGVVGHWARWHLLMTALLTVLFYTFRLTTEIYRWLVHDIPIKGTDVVLNPYYLIVLIPLGILWGDSLYEKDRLANETKPKEKIL